MDQCSSKDSTPSSSPQTSPYKRPTQPNPYQRTPSRRAIACVTCAKAKTKCDKGLPSCSRCITKGIKCDPRSTRRTSENSYRPNMKKSYASPKRYQSTSAIPSVNQITSPQNLSLSKRRAMRAVPPIDINTAIKMGQRSSVLSGFPILTPLPTATYSCQATNERHSVEDNADQGLVDYLPVLDGGSFPVSGCLTPQTPGPVMYHEPISMDGISEHLATDQTWPDDSLVSLGFNLDNDTSSMPAMGQWSLPEPSYVMPMTQMPWNQSPFSLPPQAISNDFVPHAAAMAPLSLAENSMENFDTTAAFDGTWDSCPIDMPQIGMGILASSGPFMQDFRSSSDIVPIWEDAFIPGPGPVPC